MRLSKIIPGVATIILATAHVPARADCNEDSFTWDTIRSASVRGDMPRVYFVQDQALVPGCPNASVACRAKAFVVLGDIVLLGEIQGNYSCTAFTGTRGITTIQWLPTASVTPIPNDVLAVNDWTGQWAVVERHIAITRAQSGNLAIKGDATWGAMDPERVRRGAVNMGEISAEAQPTNDIVAFTVGEGGTLPYDRGDDTTCRVRMLRRGPYLLVKDNNACGGMNVSFSGIYRRRG